MSIPGRNPLNPVVVSLNRTPAVVDAIRRLADLID